MQEKTFEQQLKVINRRIDKASKKKRLVREDWQKYFYQPDLIK